MVSSVGGQASRAAALVSSVPDLLSLGSFVFLGLPTAWLAPRGRPCAPPSARRSATSADPAHLHDRVGADHRHRRPLIRAWACRPARAWPGCWPRSVRRVRAAPGCGWCSACPSLLGIWPRMDAGLNTAVALTGRQRLLNLLHGRPTASAPRIGRWSSPPPPHRLVAARLPSSRSTSIWSCAPVLRQRAVTAPGRPAGDPAPAAGTVAPSRSRRAGPGAVHRRVIAGMGVFFVYTGLEVGARAVGGQPSARPPAPVGGRDRPGRVRLLGR